MKNSISIIVFILVIIFLITSSFNIQIDKLKDNDTEKSSIKEDINQDKSLTPPTSLLEFADEMNLPKEDVHMLASISFRGEQPKSKSDWRFLYESIIRSTRG